MRKGYCFLLALGLVLGMAAPLLTHPWLACCSCAPGELCCGASCHGYPGGTIYVARFPARYQPAQTYCIKVGHNGGDSIESFNCSVKVGRGSVNAGRLQAGYLTETYSCSSQTIDGVRPVSRCDTCNFFWTAPPAARTPSGSISQGFRGSRGNGVVPRNSFWLRPRRSAGPRRSGSPFFRVRRPSACVWWARTLSGGAWRWPIPLGARSRPGCGSMI